MIKGILTDREMEVIRKKLAGDKLSQLDSNVLTRSVRPKLKAIKNIDGGDLLRKLKYNQKSISIENKIKELILRNVKDVESIILYGSAVHTNYSEYNDLDVIIVTERRYWKSWKEKNELVQKIKDLGINLDVQLIDKKTLLYEYPHSPSLIYQLSYSKIIYGKIKLPKRIKIHKYDLLMKLDWSEVFDQDNESKELYLAIRNTILVELLLRKIVNNNVLKQKVEEYLGRILAMNLKKGNASKMEKALARNYLNKLNKEVTDEIKNSKWENLIL